MNTALPRRDARRLQDLDTGNHCAPSEPPSSIKITWSVIAAVTVFALTVGVLVVAIIAGPKTEPVAAAELRGVTPSRFNPSITMVTQTPTPTQPPAPAPTTTPQPARLLTSGLAGLSDTAGVSTTCSNKACAEIKSAFVWMCWSGKVVESSTRPFEFMTLSNLPTCVRAARLDGSTSKNQSFGISGDLWRALTGSTPGFKMFVLDMYDIAYPPPYPELLTASQLFTSTVPKQ